MGTNNDRKCHKCTLFFCALCFHSFTSARSCHRSLLHFLPLNLFCNFSNNAWILFETWLLFTFVLVSGYCLSLGCCFNSGVYFSVYGVSWISFSRCRISCQNDTRAIVCVKFIWSVIGCEYLTFNFPKDCHLWIS